MAEIKPMIIPSLNLVSKLKISNKPAMMIKPQIKFVGLKRVFKIIGSKAVVKKQVAAMVIVPMEIFDSLMDRQKKIKCKHKSPPTNIVLSLLFKSK